MTVWPLVDGFEEGSPVYGATVRGYLGARLVDSSAWRRARLHNGRGQVASAAGHPDDTLHAEPGPACGFVRRQEFPEDVRVEVTARKVSDSGLAVDTDLGAHGCIARLQAGSAYTDAMGLTRYAGLQDCTAYTFTVEKDGTDQLRLILRRWNLGVPTVLAQTGAFDADLALWSLDHKLRLDVVTVAGDVELSGSVEAPMLALGFTEGAPLATIAVAPGGSGVPEVVPTGTPHGLGGGVVLELPPGGIAGTGVVIVSPQPHGPIGPPGNVDHGLVELVTHTDPAVSALTGGGRCGLILDPEFLSATTGNPVTSACDLLMVADLADPAAPVVLWEDAWARSTPDIGQLVGDLHGVVGRGLDADYSTDDAGREAVTLLTKLSPDRTSQAGVTDLGQAVQLDGVTDYLSLPDPSLAMPLPLGPATLRMSVAVWVRLLGNRDGNGVWEAMIANEHQGMAVGFLDAGGGDLDLQVRLGTGTDVQVYTVALGSETPYLNQNWRVVLTYDADTTPTNEGRLKVYLGRFGQAVQVMDQVVPFTLKPELPVDTPHALGRHRTDPAGTNAETYMHGVIDQPAVFYRVLTVGEVDQVCFEAISTAELVALGAVHVADFDTAVTFGLAWQFTPVVPDGVTDVSGKWVVNKAGSTLVDGLAPNPSDTGAFAAHGRPAESDHDQTRSAMLKLPTTSARAGIVLRGTGASRDDLTGYSVSFLAASPQALVRVSRWRDGVLTPIGRQSAGSTAAALVGTDVVLAVTCQRLNPSQADSPVVITATLDGTPILLAPDPLAADVAVTVGGADLVDASVDRILSGGVTGLIVGAEVGSPVEFDTWTVVLPTATPGVASAPAIVLPTEDAGAHGDLSDVLELDWHVERRASVTRSLDRMEDDRVRVQAISTYERRAYNLQRTTLGTGDQSVEDALVAFWEGHVGAGPEGQDLAFAWTPPSPVTGDDPPGLWFFVGTSLEFRTTSKGQRPVAFDIVEAVASA